MLGDPFAQQIRILDGGQNHKGFRKAGAKGGFRLCDPLFSAGNFGCIAGEKVIHGLGRRQFGNGRHDTKSIGGEHNDIGGMASPTRRA